MNSKYCVVLVTCPSEKEGSQIALGLLEEKLAACVNVVSRIKSYSWWQGTVENGVETLLIIKTRLSRIKRVESWVRKHHSYTVPEIIALPVVAGSRAYLNWLGENV